VAGERRRLVAILAADAAGYSRRMAEDEAGALALIARVRGVLEPAIAAHGGRLFKAMGDGFLAEFPSTVDGLRCALAVQAKLSADEVAAPGLRVGLHVGDVVVQGEDLLGDGVNVAARIQALAEPGGIALSARVREDAAGRVSLHALEDLGERELKNIPAPVRVFRLAPGSAPAAPAAPAPKLATLDRPALAVLPFANLSGEAEQDYFADGITEELTTQLSRARWFYVIARNSAFTYKGRAVDIRQVGRELGARYVLRAACAGPAGGCASPASSSRRKPATTSGPTASTGRSTTSSTCRTASPKPWSAPSSPACAMPR
jgi:adenylate cyclase